MNGRIIKFRELLWKTKDEKLCFKRIKRQEVGRHPIGCVSCVLKVSYEKNPKLRLIRKVEYHQRKGC